MTTPEHTAGGRAMKWNKRSSLHWEIGGEGFLATIDKVSGNNGFPYMWDVRATPCPAQGRWDAFAKGSCRKLAEAKAEAEAAIQKMEGAR